MHFEHLYHEQDGIRIFCGDNRKIISFLGQYDLLLTDPPYGIGEGNQKRILSRANAANAKDYGHSDWDSKPAEQWMIQMAISKATRSIIWGGNYFTLPASKCWLVWDKENGQNDFADCELAWTNLDMAVRRIKYRWAGMLQANMAEKDVRYHPTQKATTVMEWCIDKVPDAKTVLDPWMGSGTTLIAARAKGLQADGIEINEQYCEASKRRLAQGVLLAA